MKPAPKFHIYVWSDDYTKLTEANIFFSDRLKKNVDVNPPEGFRSPVEAIRKFESLNNQAQDVDSKFEMDLLPLWNDVTIVK
jgi:hypothetical protein